jgi:hypothetical protein
MAAPVITLVSESRTVISDEAGVDTSLVKFTSDVDMIEWEARADGTGNGTGLLVGNETCSLENNYKVGAWALGAKPFTSYNNANVEKQFNVDWNELTNGDKTYKINIYARNTDGWTGFQS